MIIVIARLRAHAERLEEFRALLEDVQTASRADEGCVNYGYYESIDEPSSFIAVEEWRDEEALRAHLITPHVGRLIAALGEFVDGRLEIAAHDVASTGPLPLPA